jgi:glycosyltransferase Alg8
MQEPVPFQWKVKDLFYLFLYIAVLVIVVTELPKNVVMYYETRSALLGFSFLGLWRYGWLFTHIVRSLLYSHWVFPRRRLLADRLWNGGWRPPRLTIMMTTFKELPSTTEKVLQSIVEQGAEMGVPLRLFIGTGTDADELVIERYFKKQRPPFSLQVILVRQKLPGKRFAIGQTLRAILRHGLEADDAVIFMDGDTFFTPGCLRKCLPFFALYPTLQALTTNENSIVHNGPEWMKKWLEMRFAQRHFTMQSYCFSNKVLTLTGRMSVFRGKHLLEPGFMEIVEQDCLAHWLWGAYRFLSGDDKSTWYYLLKAGADMFYIPDALTTTIENIQGNAVTRMKENLKRWTGNTLRNGERAMALGPRKIGFFIWWCLVDQRITVWTMFFGHAIFLTLALTRTPAFLVVAVAWIACTRLFLASILFYHSRRIDLSFPFLLYINQAASAIVKIYILFRLPQQRWTNRGDQQAGFNAEHGSLPLREWVASYLTLFYCTLCLFCVLLYLKLITFPQFADALVLQL